MRHLVSMVLALVLTLPLLAGDITFEGEQKTSEYSIARVRARGDFKSFLYRVYGPDNKRIKIEKGENGWVLFTGRPGEYRVEAIAIKGEEIAEGEFVVTIEGKPEPKPPVPDDDELTKRLKDAYMRETQKDRARKTTLLADVYTSASKLNLDTVGMAGELSGAMLKARKLAGISDDDIKLVRSEVAAELRKVLPEDGEEKLTADHRVMAKTAFSKIGLALIKVAAEGSLKK